jgi:hypothetical protein
METRELYRQKYEAQLHVWSAKIEALGAQADKMTAEARLEAKLDLDALRGKMKAANARLVELAEVTEDKWDDVTRNADHAWSEIKAAVEGAYEAVKKHEKN